MERQRIVSCRSTSLTVQGKEVDEVLLSPVNNFLAQSSTYVCAESQGKLSCPHLLQGRAFCIHREDPTLDKGVARVTPKTHVNFGEF